MTGYWKEDVITIEWGEKTICVNWHEWCKVNRFKAENIYGEDWRIYSIGIPNDYFFEDEIYELGHS